MLSQAARAASPSGLRAVARAWAARSGGAPAFSATPPPSFSSWARQAGLRSPYRRDIDPEVALYGLIGANVAVFGAWRASDARPALRSALTRHTVSSPSAILAGRPWTLLTAAFSHRDTTHMLINMVTLFFFGGSVGRRYGGRRLIGLYLAAGVAGSAAQAGADAARCASRPPGFRWDACISAAPGCLGASGAVNGILALSILANPRATVLVYGILPVPAFILGGLYVLQDLRGASRGGGGGGGGVAHWGHLGGAAVGAAVWAARVRTGRWW